MRQKREHGYVVVGIENFLTNSVQSGRIPHNIDNKLSYMCRNEAYELVQDFKVRNQR